MKTRRPKGFLNVDLEIESRFRLDPLLEYLSDSVGVHYCGPTPGTKAYLLAVDSARFTKSPGAAILALCASVDRLPPPGRRLWDLAQRRTFDVGYEMEARARTITFRLKPEILRRLADLGATLAVTCYRRLGANKTLHLTAGRPKAAGSR